MHATRVWRRRIGLLTAAAVIVALNVMVGWMLYNSRQATRQAAVQSASNLAAALERDIARSVELYDLSLQGVQEGMRLPDIDEYSPEMRSLILFDRAASARHLGSIRVLNAEGDTTASALQEKAPSSGEATEQEYFRVHREHPDTGLFVSRPVRSPWTGTYGIVLSRRLTRANGSFAGVVSGSIRLSFFQDLFADLKLGDRSTIGLFRTDGTLLLRTPFNEADVGRDLRTASLFQHFPQARAGVYESVAQMDGERRLYVYAQVADLPLVLSVATSVRSIYADWWHQAIEFSVVMLLLDITVSGLLIDLMRELRQRAAAETELARANCELAELATHDPLTGLANRRGFSDMLRREWRRCAREEEPLSLLVLDVDNFKGFNDLYGHGCGDECLKIIASAITRSIRRPSDLAARYGGEEFVVVLPTTYLDDAMVIGEAIRQAVVQEAVPHRDGPAGVVSVSIGAACSISLVEPTTELLIETADNALYQAKHNGRNRIECLPDLNTSSVMHDRLRATVS
jgi:diguanylate cyclase (GGDEF)-like protein